MDSSPKNNKSSRTKNSVRNASFVMASEVLSVLLRFALRTVFIKTLGAEYLGINGLFTNVLHVLSFAELGMGNAIIYGLYKPVAENDEYRIVQLLKFYRSAYRIVFMVVFSLGLLITPFIGSFISERPNITEPIELIFLLFVFNTAFSYLLVWRRTLINMHQKKYINVLIDQGVDFAMVVGQIIYLYQTKNYLGFLVIDVCLKQLKNVVASIVAGQMFPYIKDLKDIKRVDKKEKVEIFRNVRALFLYKFAGVALHQTDNIIIVALRGLAESGIYSNYSMVLGQINTSLSHLVNSVTESVGNLNVKASVEKQANVLHKLQATSFLLYSNVCIGFVCAISAFVEAWVGAEYVLSIGIVLAALSAFYVNGMQTPAYIYRTTLGVFVENRYVPVVSAILNIILSIWWGKLFGIAGILAATAFAKGSTTTWVDPYNVFNKRFGLSPKAYYSNMLLYTGAMVVCGAICYWLTQFIQIAGWFGIGLKGIVSLVLYNVLCFLVLRKNTFYLEMIAFLYDKASRALFRRNKAQKKAK